MPNISKSSTTLSRCKTGVSLKSSSLKRTAAPPENHDAPATKQTKAVPKTGLGILS